MTDTIKKAIEKIDQEAEKAKDTNARLIASHIIDNYLNTDANAQKALAEKKTIKDCMEHIKKKAKTLATSGVAMVEDEKVFDWVRGYYGFNTSSTESSKIIDIFDMI